MKNGSNKLLVECFLDHPGQPLEAKKDAGGGGKKKGGGKTVTSFFKSQLDDLMKVLYSTDPSFIRCVVPNTHKQPGGVQPELIMHQYQCNGVLAGIAICRLGFPNKLQYPDFKARYNILAATAVAKAKNDKGAAQAVMDAIKLDKEKWRLGHTKVFFRAGILGFMEEVREDKIGSVLSLLQAQARGKASRLVFKIPSVIIESAKLGFGGLCGLQSSQILNVPNLLNTRLNMKRKLPLLKLISTKL